ncbi:PAS domain-containing sensor histidine kinase [Algoriphagus kandeliae]|uniref:histidine kinase n=2 Tax=Algoriphagus kandeliae TaxID=2562278 RepID=A0A4Y9QZ55_9BACT|nr:PAS domain-containing sensor histidine kinase [Algoriphagus kandeliae]
MILSIYIALSLDQLIRWLATTMILVTVWGFFYGLELASTSLDQMLHWVRFEYIGISFAPAVWLIFTLRYTGYRNWAKPGVLIGTFTIPALTLFMVISNELHHLHYTKTFLVTEGSPFPILGIERGPYYIIHVLYSYLAFLLGTIILWRRFQFADPLYKNQTRLLIAGGFFPLIFNFFYQTGVISPLGFIDLTPFAFLATYLILGLAILKYGLFSIKPIAHGKIMESLTKGVLVFNVHQRVIDFNSKVKSFCKDPQKIKIGAQAKDIFQSELPILQIFESPKEQTITFNPEGSDRTIRIEVMLIEDKDSERIGLILLFDDLTEELKTTEKLRKQTEDLQKLNDLKDKFFSIISHDLKGPIFGVKELIHMTQIGMISKEELHEMLPEVSKNMEQVAILLENLLAWASSQIRKEQVEIQEFDIIQLIEQQKKLLDRIANEKQIEIKIQESEPISVKADRNMTDLVLRNLINNSIKFSKPDSEILVSVEKLNEEAKICIQDFGTGISPENLQKIEAGISFTTRGVGHEGGTGLGLILVREYISKNQGRLNIESELNQGTTFCIYLPLA